MNINIYIEYCFSIVGTTIQTLSLTNGNVLLNKPELFTSLKATAG